MSRFQNIILIGMPGSGKTATANELAKHGYQVYDTDSIFVDAYRMSVAEFFDLHGEAEFRRAETEIVASLKNVLGAVISTGGGVVLDAQNIDRLKKIGKVVFLECPVKELEHRVGNDKARPLARDGGSDYIARTWENRKDLYYKDADMIIDSGNLTSIQIADKIIEG
ncbi:MAG: shikimate kinase, partial [Firmicutes bacterium]|nr:shikimate kinase [Bacillota bacterium]